jgi:hypothetical protein
VNTYDPTDRIQYIHMARERDPYSTSLERGRTCTRLPVGYANQSSRTRLGRPRMHSRTAPRGRILRPHGEPADTLLSEPPDRAG